MIPSPMRSGSRRLSPSCPPCLSMCWPSASHCCLPAACKRHQRIPHDLLPAEPDRRYRAGLHLADSASTACCSALGTAAARAERRPHGFWGLIILMCWQQIGYMMIIYIAGLQNVPTDLIEAARNRRRYLPPDPLLRSRFPWSCPSVTICTVPDADQLLQAVRPEPLI